MADKEEGEEPTHRGNEWEVVSLTASAYAAAPGPKQVDLNDDDKGNPAEEDKGETSQAMFLSGHFVFPPSQHENLPLEPETTEINNEQGGEDALLELDVGKGGMSDTKDEENWNIKGLNMSDDFPGTPFFDEKDSSLAISGSEFEEGPLEGLNLVDDEQSIYRTGKFSSFHSEVIMGGETTVEENSPTNEPIEPSDQLLDSDVPNVPKSTDEDKYYGSDRPCEAWWKRQAASLYAHAKEANAFWSIFIATAVMGLVILGQHWQQERWQVLQLKWQSGVKDERMGRMLGPIARLKDVIVGGNGRGSFIRGSGTSAER
ncbi:hypothetical protein RJ640_023940 [Escallonia rubra]|uniref:ATG8-interacting protein 1 n=1 Tax=Escallonia rubra TaxID=112253 RepID=A0AA88RZE7_9ASTE|nr:hypothetical protein RJ640_023940 [Escallonia rubra]